MAQAFINAEVDDALPYFNSEEDLMVWAKSKGLENNPCVIDRQQLLKERRYLTLEEVSVKLYKIDDAWYFYDKTRA